MIAVLNRACDWVDTLSKYILIVLTIGIALVIAVNVGGRYIFGNPIHWAEEVTRFAFAWMTFLGAASAYKRRQLVAMSILANKFPAKMKWGVGLGVELVMTAFMVIGLVWGMILLKTASVQTSAALGIRMTYAYLCIPLSCGFMLLYNLTQVLTMLKTRQPLIGWGEDWS